MSWPATTLAVRHPSEALSLSQGEPLSTKPTSWADTPQGARTVRQSRTAEPESKVSTRRGFPRTTDADGVGLCSRFSKWCCLCAGTHGPDGTSLMASAVLRFGGGY